MAGKLEDYWRKQMAITRIWQSGWETGSLIEGTLVGTTTASFDALSNEVKTGVYSLQRANTDGDGRYVLDYLGPEYRDMAGKKFPDVYEKASSFLESRFLEIKEKKDTELFLRYLWLADYFENRLPLWQVSDKAD